MSLVGMDGKAIQFETKPQTQAPAASPFQLTNKFAFDLPNSPAAAAAAASAASVTSPAAAAAAASSTGGGLFSSQPIALPGQPGAFAPSLPQRSSEPPPSVKIDFSEFENDIADMEEAKRREFLEGLQVNAARIASETKGTAPLPSQIGDSKLFHQMVLKQYGKVHHLEEDPKKAFASRKAKGRDARRAKKAEDKADQMEARTGGAIRKNKHKNRSKGVY